MGNRGKGKGEGVIGTRLIPPLPVPYLPFPLPLYPFPFTLFPLPVPLPQFPCSPFPPPATTHAVASLARPMNASRSALT
jgi:hypothetical protein